MSSTTRFKATPDLSKQAGRDGKKPAKVETIQAKPTTTSPETIKGPAATKAAADEKFSQPPPKDKSTTDSTKPVQTARGQATRPSVDAEKPEAKIIRSPVNSQGAESSVSLKNPAGDTTEPIAEEEPAVETQAADKAPGTDVQDHDTKEASPENALEEQLPEKGVEERPELEKFEHDLGERLTMPEAEIEKFESKDRDFKEFGQQEQGMSDTNKHASQLTPEEWEELLQNCGALCGWYVDRDSNKIVQAPKPAFQLRRSSSRPINDSLPIAADSMNPNETALAPPSDAGQEANVASTAQPLDDGGKPCSKPRYHVNDNSYVNITIVSSEFQISMATNDFSSHSTEASVGGGFGPFAASVSGGYAASKSSSKADTNEAFEKTMVAKYMFPRATIYLDPAELEPTSELLASLARLRKTKSILDMRKLQQDFGHLFCRQVTVGGRLLTTKIMLGTKVKSEQAQKQEYKVSVGVAASYGLVSASAKHEQGAGSGTAQGQAQENTNESHTFEAIGGDTLLSNNPPAWTTSCASYSNWRVIDRINLTPMADAIAEIPGLGLVKALFAQAVPALSRYTEMSQTREIKARLRLAAPTRQLSMSYLVRQPKEYTEITYYLGHSPDHEVSPSYFRIKDETTDYSFWSPDFLGLENEQKAFFPSSFRAPAIYGRASNMAAPDVDTVWRITAPFDDVLKHGCRVVLRTVPKVKNPTTQDVAGPSSRPVALSIFRTQQGVFVPSMSDESQGHIFRMLKRGSNQPGETIKEGDNIRLCWTFEDQTAGFRDFADGAFGRRRHNWPDDIEKLPYFFKLPWPRFESLAAPNEGAQPIPNSMVMSTKADDHEDGTGDMFGTLPIWNAAGVGSKVIYGVQDVCFSLDVVEDDDLVDSQDDYTLQGPKARRQIGGGVSHLASTFYLDKRA